MLNLDKGNGTRVEVVFTATDSNSAKKQLQ